MSQRSELLRRVKGLSEAEVFTVLKFVQFLEEGHVWPRLEGRGEAMKTAKVIIDDLVEFVEILEHPPEGPEKGHARP